MDDLIKTIRIECTFKLLWLKFDQPSKFCLICWKTPFAFLARLKIILNWRLHCSSRPQQLFIDPRAIQWPLFDPSTIYRPLEWSNRPLGVNIDHFENHWIRQTKSEKLWTYLSMTKLNRRSPPLAPAFASTAPTRSKCLASVCRQFLSTKVKLKNMEKLSFLCVCHSFFRQ